MIDERGTMQAHRWCSACRGVIEPGAEHIRRDGLFRHATCLAAHHGRCVPGYGPAPVQAKAVVGQLALAGVA